MEPVKKLKPKMYKAIDVYCSNPGMSVAELARVIKSPYNTVYTWWISEPFQEEITKRFKEEWKQTSKIAQRKMEDLVKNGKDEVALQASKYVLDSSGFKPDDNINLNTGDINIKITDD